MQKEIPTGICESCVHALNCVFRKEKDAPILQCEHFESKKKRTARKSGDAHGTEEVAPDRNARNYTGLCRTCALRETCTHTKPDSGVLYCEEYR